MIFKYISSLIWVALLTFSVVMPNVQKDICIASLFCLCLKYILKYGFAIFKEKYFLYYISSIPITIFYIINGQLNNAPNEAASQIIIIYIISPFLWSIVSIGVLREYALHTINSTLMFCLFFAIISQAYYFFAFLYIGPEAVSFLMPIDEDTGLAANVNISQGTSAASMYVFGSMIFLIGGFISSPRIIKFNFIKNLLLICSIISVLTSGRSALILTMFLGIIIYIISEKKQVNRIITTLLLIVIFNVVIFYFYTYIDIDLWLNIDAMLEKLTNKGGEGRNEQSYALIDGIADYYGLGAGHGVEASFTVNSIYPWRYEMVWLATIYRVGILGSIVYALPFIVVLIKAGRLFFRQKLNSNEIFLYGAFVCAFISSNTNPYIEGVIFQWMYIFPLVYFTTSNRINAKIKL